MSFFLRILIIVVAALGMLGRHSSAQSRPDVGRIEGKITVTTRDQIFEEMLRARSLIRYDEHVHASTEPRPYTLSDKAVVYIETAGDDQKNQPPTKNPQLDQQDLMFRPLVLPVVVGTAVDFPNNDEVFHNVFSYSRAKEFDLGRYPKGQRRRVVFDELGVVNVYCDIHAYMYATVLVLDNPFFTVPDDDGNYFIPSVPPGTYKLAFWYGRKKIESKTVTISPGEATIVHFTY